MFKDVQLLFENEHGMIESTSYNDLGGQIDNFPHLVCILYTEIDHIQYMFDYAL